MKTDSPLLEISEETRRYMHYSLYDPIEALKNIEEQIRLYYKQVKRSRKKEVYLSALLLDTNDITTRVIDGHVGDENRASKNSALITAHYPGGDVAYSIAFTPSPRQLHKALAEAEEEAWENRHPKPRRNLMHPKKSDLFKHFRLDLDSFRQKTYDDLSTKLAECEQAIAEVEGIVGSQALLEMTIGQEIFADSLGRRTIQEIAQMHIHLSAEAEADDLPGGRFELEEIVGCSGTAQDLDWLFHKAKTHGNELGKKTVRFSTAGPKVKPTPLFGRRAKTFELRPGRYDIVMDGAMAALTIHEMLGHSAEANRFLKAEGEGTPLYLGQKVGISSLNIIDNPLLTFSYNPTLEEIDGANQAGIILPSRIKPPSYYRVDHEGVIGGKTYIVQDGRFVSYLTTRLSAGSLDRDRIRKALTGNARIGNVCEEDESGESSPVEPDSRMSTLSIMPESDGPDLRGLLDRIKGNGLYITSGKSSGEVSTKKSQGWVSVAEVYFVDNDLTLIPLRIPHYRIDLVDNVVGYLSKIKEIGNESTVSFETSYCASDSGVVPQSCGGAAVLVEKVNIHPEYYQGTHKGALTPIPSRHKSKR